MTLPALLAEVGHPGPVWASELLQVILLVLVAAGAAAVALCRTPVRQVVLVSFYGVTLSLAFLVLQAPDVTLSAMTIGAVVLPLILLLSLSKMREHDRPSPRERRQETRERR